VNLETKYVNSVVLRYSKSMIMTKMMIAVEVVGIIKLKKGTVAPNVFRKSLKN
jgi:hypothetical protein